MGIKAQSPAHTKWLCKYHIVFSSKYRWKVIFNKIRSSIGENLREYKFGNRKFWAKGFYVTTVGLNEATVQKYIREQEKLDSISDKLSRNV
ncbi:transposase [Proteus mirabilis]|nr:transposase [Proteus mirabilis]MBO8263385.1 transposase [Proteus mirabilis]MBO8266760.1 transposase [Proteus mirabilis]MBO8271080.1 transposase [Proteus mirabilis]MBO8274680.1 transposase [Proteus mirabilis]MBO8278319.1 transposase [Proteus mirabilis]